MTISTNTARVSLACNGVSTVFPVPIQAYAAADFLVTLTSPTGAESTLNLNSDFSLAPSSTDQPPKWTLTTLANVPFVNGFTIQVILNPPQTQQTQYVQGQAFPSGAVQQNIDRAVQMALRLQDQVSRSVRAPDGDTTGLALTLPSQSLRQSQLLGTDINGNLALYPLLSGILNPTNWQFDVRNFGAKLDGVTDDTAAVLATLAANGVAFVPYTVAGIVLNNLALTSGQVLFANGNMNLMAKAGASYAVKLTGFATYLAGFTIQDTGNVVSQTTTSAGAVAGATSITATSTAQGPGIQVGQRIAIELDNGIWHATYVTSVVGTAVGLYTGIPTGRSVNNGARVWASFGMIYVTVAGAVQTIGCRIWNLIIPNLWAGILVDSPAAAAQITLCSFNNIKGTGSGRMFGLVEGRNVNNSELTDVKLFGGFTTSFNAVGNGVQTQYSFPDNVFLTREPTIQVNGVTQVLGTNYSWVGGSNRTIQFTAAPGNGLAVTGTSWSYGVEGIAMDKVPIGSAVLPQGGSDFADCSTVQWQRGWNLRNAQLFSFSNDISDTCSDASWCFDACTYGLGSLTGIFIGWAAVGLKLLNASVVKTGVNTWSLIPAGKQVLNSGAGGVSAPAESAMSVDATSTLDFGKATQLMSTTAATVAAGSTVYLGPNAAQAAQNASQWVIPYLNTLVLKLLVDASLAPGGGQSFTYNVLDVNLNNLGQIVMSGTPAPPQAVLYIPSQSLAEGGGVSVQLVTSAGAAAAFHRICLSVEPL